MNYVLDTHILIHLIKNQPRAREQRVDALPEHASFSRSFVTWAELLKGAERGTRKPEVLHRLDALARPMTVLYLAGPSICAQCAEQFTRLKDAARPSWRMIYGSRATLLPKTRRW